MQFNDENIAVVGLGYVGLPLAVEFGRKRIVVGFDTIVRSLDPTTCRSKFLTCFHFTSDIKRKEYCRKRKGSIFFFFNRYSLDTLRQP